MFAIPRAPLLNKYGENMSSKGPLMIATIRRKFRELISDEKFSEILTGSVWVLFARVLATVLALVTSIVVARLYGAEMVGILAMVQAFMMLAMIFSNMGMDTSILRLIPEHIVKHSVSSAFRVYRKVQYFVGVVSVLAGLALFFTADLMATTVFSKPKLGFFLELAAAFIVFRSLMELNTQAVRGLRMIGTFAFMQVLPQACMLLALIALGVVYSSDSNPVYAQLAAWGLTALVGVVIVNYAFRKRMFPGDAVEKMRLREILSISAPMLMTSSLQFMIAQTGVILLGIFRTESEVGYYAAAVKLATLTSFVLQAINSMVAPKFSELFHKDNIDELLYVARKSTRLIFWTTSPILLVMVAFGWPILGLAYGYTFTAAYPALVVLVIGQFINSISGSTGYFMVMTGQQRVFRNVVGTAAVVNILLCWALIPSFGLLGAAFAATVSIASWNIYILVFIKKKYGKSIGFIPILVRDN